MAPWRRGKVCTLVGVLAVSAVCLSLTVSAPLGREFDDWDGINEAWNSANVGRFISCVGVVDRQHCYEMWNDTNHEYWEPTNGTPCRNPKPQS